MLQALLEGDIRIFERMLNEFVVGTLSFYDTGGKEVEKVYQAFLLGLLVNLQQAGVTEIVKMAITFDGKRVWIAKQ